MIATRNRATAPPLKLTPRQRQVQDHLLRGDSRKQIAAKLGMSTNTVGAHVKAIYRHYGVGGQLELVLLLGSDGGRKPRRSGPTYTPGRVAERVPWDKGGGG